MQNTLKPNYKFVQDIFAGRKDRVGASDIPALIANPAKQGESFAGYGRTAITVYEEKIGIAEKEPQSLPAKMGKLLEPIVLREFIEDFYNVNMAIEFYESYMLFELAKFRSAHPPNSKKFNNECPFKHNTEALEDYGVAHGDCLYDPEWLIRDGHTLNFSEPIIIKKGVKFDKTKPALIEGKTSQFWAARRGEDALTGYDFKQSGWQGIPMRVYLQALFQMPLYNVFNVYVALMSNTSQKGYWHIKPNKKWIARLQQLAWDMRKAIINRQPPREMAISAADITKLYTEIKDDYTVISGEELDRAVGLVRDYRDAQAQHKTWKRREEEYRDAAAVILKGSGRVKGIINGKLETIFEWKETGGDERVMGLGDIREVNNGKRYESYLRRNGLIKKTKKSRKPDIKLKIKES